MQVMEENEDIAFLYHLVEGYAESSLACHIASLAGLPDELVKRAHQVCTNTSISNNNWTEWSTIQGVIARVISKSEEREARGRFENTSAITP